MSSSAPLFSADRSPDGLSPQREGAPRVFVCVALNPEWLVFDGMTRELSAPPGEPGGEALMPAGSRPVWRSEEWMVALDSESSEAFHTALQIELGEGFRVSDRNYGQAAWSDWLSRSMPGTCGERYGVGWDYLESSAKALWGRDWGVIARGALFRAVASVGGEPSDIIRAVFPEDEPGFIYSGSRLPEEARVCAALMAQREARSVERAMGPAAAAAPRRAL